MSVSPRCWPRALEDVAAHTWHRRDGASTWWQRERCILSSSQRVTALAGTERSSAVPSFLSRPNRSDRDLVFRADDLERASPTDHRSSRPCRSPCRSRAARRRALVAAAGGAPTHHGVADLARAVLRGVTLRLLELGNDGDHDAVVAMRLMIATTIRTSTSVTPRAAARPTPRGLRPAQVRQVGPSISSDVICMAFSLLVC